MAVRGHRNDIGYCNHWYLTFDGNKCTNPDTIEMLDYSPNLGDHHRTMSSRNFKTIQFYSYFIYIISSQFDILLVEFCIWINNKSIHSRKVNKRI